MKAPNIIITAKKVRKLIATVDQGLCSGLGHAIPGQMCVEAAVCYALGLPHGDNPRCVDEELRNLKITLNDADWKSDESRAKGMRRLAVLQLGTKKSFDTVHFAKEMINLGKKFTKRVSSPYLEVVQLRVSDAMGYLESGDLRAAISEISLIIDDVVNDKDKNLKFFARSVENILIEMNVPGVKWLPLLDE